MSFFGHVMRNKEIESIIISGKIEGKRYKGRQRIPIKSHKAEVNISFISRKGYQ